MIPSTYVPHARKVGQLHEWLIEQEKLGKIIVCEHTGITRNREKCMKGTFLTHTGKKSLIKELNEAISKASCQNSFPPKKFVSPWVTANVTFAQVVSEEAADIIETQNVDPQSGDDALLCRSLTIEPKTSDNAVQAELKETSQKSKFLSKPGPAPGKKNSEKLRSHSRRVPAPLQNNFDKPKSVNKPVPAPRKREIEKPTSVSKPVPAPRKKDIEKPKSVIKPVPAPRKKDIAKPKSVIKPVPAPRKKPIEKPKSVSKPVPVPRKKVIEKPKSVNNPFPATPPKYVEKPKSVSKRVLAPRKKDIEKPKPQSKPIPPPRITDYQGVNEPLTETRKENPQALTKPLLALKQRDSGNYQALIIPLPVPTTTGSEESKFLCKHDTASLIRNSEKKSQFSAPGEKESEKLKSLSQRAQASKEKPCEETKPHNMPLKSSVNVVQKDSNKAKRGTILETWITQGYVLETCNETRVVVPHSHIQNIFKYPISKDVESKPKLIKFSQPKKYNLSAKVGCPYCSESCRTQDRLLNHFLKQHTRYMTNKIGGGPLSTSSKQSTRIDMVVEKPRKEALRFSFPNVRKPIFSKILDSLNEGMKITDPYNSKFSPPISTIEQITKLVDNHQTRVFGVELDYGTFAWPDFLQFKDIYAMKDIKREVEEESKWLSDCNYLSRDQYSRHIDISDIEKFINLIQNSSPAHLRNTGYPTEDLKTLCCSRWLTMDCIMYIANLLTLTNKSKNTVVINANANLHKEKLTETISNLQKEYGSRLKELRIILLMHIGVSSNGTYISSLGKQGNHFSMATYDIGKGKVVYADSLAWPVPQNMVYLINSIALQTSNVSPIIRTCHSNQCENNQNCTDQCARFYPRQKCTSACGIAVIVGTILSYLDCDRYNIMCSSDISKCQLEEIKPFKYLSNISEYSKYLRCSIISWIMNGKIDIMNISMHSIEQVLGKTSLNMSIRIEGSNKVSCDSGNNKLMNADHSGVSKEAEVRYSENNERKVFRKKRINRDNNSIKYARHKDAWLVTKSISVNGQTFNHSFDFSFIQRYLKHKPSVFYRKQKQKIDLECLLINGTKRTKTFKLCNGIEGTLCLVQDFVKTRAAEWLEGHIASKESSYGNYKSDKFVIAEEDREYFYRCEFNHIKSSSHIRITVHLLDGTTKHKLFKCKGENDDICNKQIQDFFDNDFTDFLCDKWEEVTKVTVGDKTREYVDNIPFNTRVQWFIQDSIDVHNPPSAALASLNEHPRWGKTLRIDSSFSSNVNNCNEEEVVKLTIRCTSQTNSCKTSCGMLLQSMPPIDVKHPFCPNCNMNISCQKQCYNCKNTYSSRWVKVDGADLCNTCYVHFNKHSDHRRTDLDSSNDTIKRHKHLLCKWKLKLVLKSSNLNEWIVYQSANNTKIHQGESIQEARKMSLTDRDRIDRDRVTVRATPRQLELSLLSSPVTVGDQTAPPTFTKPQLKKRFQIIDRHILKQSIGNGVQPSHSQWENTEKILTQNTSKVLFFQRGDVAKDRNYHIILASDENTECLSKYGRNICGYDIKHDFNEMRLKTGALTYCDSMNKGRVGAFTISNSETADTHLTSWQIILSNLKCSKSDCPHERKLYIFNDGTGFVRLRPCVIENGPEYIPFLQHDKDTALLNASKAIKTKSSLCNFHALQCIRDILKKPMYRELQQFLEPLMFGFKCIMRSYNTQTRKSMQEAYKCFINDTIPDDIVSQEEKRSFLEYLDTFWFNSRWNETYTAEIMYALNEVSRRNPLVLTNNITERKFRDIDESLFNCKMNKLISNQVNKFMNKWLVSEVKLTADSEKEYERKGNCVPQPLTWRQKSFISKALDLIDNDKVMYLPGSEGHGWVIVHSRSIEVNNQVHSQQVFGNIDRSEGDFQSSDDEESVYSDCNNEYNIYGQPGAEHSYSSLSAAIRIVSKMKYDLSNKYKKVLMADAPHEVRNASAEGHVCNLSMSVCSCISFLSMGQPKFCKHLYACMALKIKERDEKKIFQAYVNHIPKLPYFQPQTKNYQDIQNEKKDIDWTRLKGIVEMAHIPSTEEKQALKLGVLFSETRESVVCEQADSSMGRPKKRVPHRGGFRREHIDKFIPNVCMPLEARKRKAGTEQGHAKRKEVKRRKQDCENVYHDQLHNIAVTKVNLSNRVSEINSRSSREPLETTNSNNENQLQQQALSAVKPVKTEPSITLHQTKAQPRPQIRPPPQHVLGVQSPTIPLALPVGLVLNNMNLQPQRQPPLIKQQPVLGLQSSPLFYRQANSPIQHVGLRVVWLNINGILQPAYIK